MRHGSKAISIFAAGLLLLVLACSSSSTSPGAPSDGQSATPRPQPSATAAPRPTPLPVARPPSGKPGGLLRVAGFADIPHLDVHQTVQETLASLGPGLAYSRLLKVRWDPTLGQPNQLLECDLCTGWKLTSDFAYEFELRDDVNWQNIAPVNGRRLVAGDLVYSYERLRTPGWPNAWLLGSFDKIEALGPHTLRLSLKSADADALLALADGHSKIVAREVVEQYGDLRESPVVGTGPWVWDSSEHSAGTFLSRNPDYFQPGLPLLDQLAFVPIGSPSSNNFTVSPGRQRLAAFRTGAVDVALLPPAEWQSLLTSDSRASSIVSRQGGTGLIFSLNVQSPILQDVMVRRAIFRAMDPWDYVDTVWSGQGFVSLGLPVQSPAWLLDRSEMRGSHFADPDIARDLLAAAGVSPGQEIELTVRTERFGKSYLELEARIAGDLRTVGFNPVIRRLNPEQFNDAVLNHGDYELALGVFPPASTANGFLMGLAHSEGRWNISAHRDLVLDLMIEGQAGEFNPERRREQLREIQRRLLDKAYLFSPVSGAMRWVFQEGVRGLYPNTALSEYGYWSRVWLDR